MSASGTAAPAGGDAAALPDGHVTIVGAGLVGLCTAAWLQRDGRPVRLVDPGGPGEGASYGNAGIVSTSGVTPVAMPGIVRRVPGMLLDPLGPLAIRPAYLPRLLPWLARFIAASRPADVERIARSLAALSVDAIAHYEPLLEAADAGDLLQRNGSLYLYETEEQWRGVQGEIALRQRAGAEIELLGAEEIRQMVPALGPRYAGAIFAPTSGHIANPLALSQRLAGLVERQGGSFLRARVGDFVYRGGRLAALTSDAGELPVKDVVIAAGAFSRRLAAQAGAPVPLDTERGYHLMLPDPQVEVRLPMLTGGGAVTPMQHGLRLAGTVELAGTGAAPNWARADRLLERMRHVLPGLNAEGAERWMGFRPSMPDSLPVLGPAPQADNVWLAFGHGHLGLTQAAVSGRLIADLMAGRKPVIDPAPYRATRF